MTQKFGGILALGSSWLTHHTEALDTPQQLPNWRWNWYPLHTGYSNCYFLNSAGDTEAIECTTVPATNISEMLLRPAVLFFFSELLPASLSAIVNGLEELASDVQQRIKTTGRVHC
ncbi:hypothetical protein Y1Q_0023718 [Alligator mississippiensis]|uniref:Uncharacterized protein n=1 Tax=Alligator mississippiensis TaxID=8496 RepID=A0A151MJZ2_ALLMI|nr:hypothetical protein Y1Q_0023718 [Alligator mississippiensis]